MDTRTQQILDRMGIDVWRMRSSVVKTDPDSALPVTDPVPELPDEKSDGDGALASIASTVANCTRCSLSKTRNRVVPGEGYARADWMFVGEAPGQEEDRQGRPFVGAAGKLLDAMIAALGMDRSQVYIANVIKCRPPNNRNPLAEEVSSCSGYLHQQLQIVQPRVIVALGRVSAQLLLGGEQSMARMRQKIHHFGAHETPLIATYHPAYLLRSPADKSKAWHDLLLAKSILRSD